MMKRSHFLQLFKALHFWSIFVLHIDGFGFKIRSYRPKQNHTVEPTRRYPTDRSNAVAMASFSSRNRVPLCLGFPSHLALYFPL